MRDNDALRDEAVRECRVPPTTSRNPDDHPHCEEDMSYEYNRTVD